MSNPTMEAEIDAVEAKIKRILLELEERIGEEIDSVEVDMRNFTRMTVSILIAG